MPATGFLLGGTAVVREIPAPTEEVDAGMCGGEAMYREVFSMG